MLHVPYQKQLDGSTGFENQKFPLVLNETKLNPIIKRIVSFLILKPFHLILQIAKKVHNSRVRQKNSKKWSEMAEKKSKIGPRMSKIAEKNVRNGG